MVKIVTDMRVNKLYEIIKDKDVLGVYFLIEKNTDNAYHKVVPVIITNKAIFVSPRWCYSFESTGGGRAALKDVIRSILKKDKNFNKFQLYCVENNLLDKLESDTILEITELPLPTECEEDSLEVAKKALEEIKNEVLRSLNEGNS